jgi:beta-fructofuranosidase
MTVVEPSSRARPHVHFTARDGWINDPFGISWDGSQYHLFFQTIPGRVTWAPNCHWGHATSPDLVHWTERPLALVPQPFEMGCWSGTAVMDERAILYTRITKGDWGRGAIALARGDESLLSWHTNFDDVVIAGPPDGLDVLAFRDPFVFQHGDAWVMVVGAGLSGEGAALQYHSDGIRKWTFDGVLAHGSFGLWTGKLWECPQLFPLADSWVLLVSVWNDDILHYVAGAVGDYDGRSFHARRWQQLTYGNCAYAMTAFRDRAGRACVMSWLREEPQNDPTLVGWAGAHSAPALIELANDDRLVLVPHPDVLAAVPMQPAGEGAKVHTANPVLLSVPAGAAIRANGVEIAAGAEGAAVLLDADLIEIFGSTRYAAHRAPKVNRKATP